LQQVYAQMDWILASVKESEKNKLIENLSPVYKQLLPRIRITTLGQFNILCNNKILDSKAFGGSRPILLLKSIVLHGSKDIPKEVLIDELWPKATAKAGDKNFKINLHRLRKAIEPNPKKEFGYFYIVQKAGLISLDSELVTLDVDEFIAFGAKAVKNEINSRFETALEFYDKAAQIYKGDYFSEEPYMEWMSRKRELFKVRFVELLQKKAMLHEELDQIDEAIKTWNLILSSDPWLEAAYQNLMILYADSGQKKKALDVFDQCRSIFREDLGTKPDEQTFNIYNRITSR